MNSLVNATVSPELSIIIVNWNTCDVLTACLASIYGNSCAVTFEVIVADNASNDGSVRMIETQYPDVQLIQNSTNVGFARANNQAVEQSAGRYVLLLNPDTELHDGALDVLLTFMEEHPDAGAAGPRLLNPDGTLQTSCYPAPTVLRELWRLFHLDAVHAYGNYEMERWSVASARTVDVVQGACLLIRRDVLEQVGLLDERYFIYSEEVDLCHRIRAHGWNLYWVPQAEVVHHGGQSTRQVAQEMFLQLYRSKVLYFRKHYGRLTVWLYKLVLLSATLARLLVSPLAWLEQPPKRQQDLILANNYRRLLMHLHHL